MDGRRRALGAGGKLRIPLTDQARMAERRAREFERESVRIGAGADIVPVKDVQAELTVPPRTRRRKRGVLKSLRGGMRVGIEGSFPEADVTRPPADGDFLRVHRVA